MSKHIFLILMIVLSLFLLPGCTIPTSNLTHGNPLLTTAAPDDGEVAPDDDTTATTVPDDDTDLEKEKDRQEKFKKKSKEERGFRSGLGQVSSHKVVLDDDRVIDCVVYNNKDTSTMTCDWDHVRQEETFQAYLGDEDDDRDDVVEDDDQDDRYDD